MITDENWNRAVTQLRRSENIVVLTGAGISAESGIATFRDFGAFWDRFPPEEYAHWSGLIEKAVLEPDKLADFLLAVLEPIALAKPNPGHVALAQLSSVRDVAVVTQNIDGLHQVAGSPVVHEIHGSIFHIVQYPSEERVREITRDELALLVDQIRESRRAVWGTVRLLGALSPLLGITSEGMYRPQIVLFGEAMAEPAWTQAQQAAEACDLFLLVGTSQTVQPAAQLPEAARQRGVPIIRIDTQEEGRPGSLVGPAGELLPKLIAAAFPESAS